MSLVAIAGCVGAASVCNKHKVILNKVYGLLLAVLNINYLLCDFLVADGFDYYIFNIHTVFDSDIVCLKIFYERQNHTIVLIILCKTKCTEIGKSVNMMNIAAKITLHLKCA